MKAAASRRVVLLSKVDFWHGGAGHRARIRTLVQWLSQHTRLSIVLPVPPDAAALALLATVVPQAHIHALNLPPRGTRQQALAAFAAFFQTHPQDACIVEYLDMAWLRAAVPPSVLTLVDTHDVVSQRDAELVQLGPLNRPVLTAADERRQLGRFDKVIAIGTPDAQVFSQWLGPDRVVLAPHAHAVHAHAPRAELRRLLFVGSAYAPNIEGLRWFLNEVWPALRVQGLLLDVVGDVGPAMALQSAPDLCVHGVVADLGAAYARADLCINPVRHGSGLKIKTVEALAHGLPLVSTRHGVRGLQAAAGQAFVVADDAAAFVQAVLHLAAHPAERERLGQAALALAAQAFSPQACYGPLLEVLNGHVA